MFEVGYSEPPMPQISWAIMTDEGVECIRCNERVAVAYPIRVYVLMSMVKAFTELHSKCTPKKKED